MLVLTRCRVRRFLLVSEYIAQASLCSFYGINLNQNVVLQQIGFDGKSGSPWTRLFKIATGNLIITALGFVPGYYVTVLTIEKLGRKWIQTQGFLMAALFLAILAGLFNTLHTVPFIVCFALLQFFFNFGANATTYVGPSPSSHLAKGRALNFQPSVIQQKSSLPSSARRRMAYPLLVAKQARSSPRSRSTSSPMTSAHRLCCGVRINIVILCCSVF